MSSRKRSSRADAASESTKAILPELSLQIFFACEPQWGSVEIVEDRPRLESHPLIVITLDQPNPVANRAVLQ
jgi:hypothetical protein